MVDENHDTKSWIEAKGYRRVRVFICREQPNSWTADTRLEELLTQIAGFRMEEETSIENITDWGSFL